MTEKLDLDALEHNISLGDPLGDVTAPVQLFRKLIARIRELERDKADWLKANAPGGWIDDLRRASQPGSGEADMVMLPKEPTPEMKRAGAMAIRFDTPIINKLWTGNAVYRAMVGAAIDAARASLDGRREGHE